MSPFFMGVPVDGEDCCCDEKKCEGEYDVLCYSAATGKEILRQYHGHGGFGVNFGIRQNLYYHPLRIAVGSSSVLVSSVTTLSIAGRAKCGDAHMIQQGSGDYFYHLAAPTHNQINSYSNPATNPNKKWNFSGPDYRFGWRTGVLAINGGDSFWVGGYWFRKDQSSAYRASVVGTVNWGGGGSGYYEGAICKGLGLSHIGYHNENGYWELGPSQDDITAVIPWYADLDPGVDLSETWLSSVADHTVQTIGGHGGHHNGSADFIRWVGHGGSGPQFNPSSNFGWYSTGEMNPRGPIVGWDTPPTYDWHGPPWLPLLFQDVEGWVWQLPGEPYGSSRIPSRSSLSISRTGFAPEQAFAWDKYGILGAPQPEKPINNPASAGMFGPACIGSDGLIYCLDRTAGEILDSSASIYTRLHSYSALSTTVNCRETVKATNSVLPLGLLICDPFESERRNSISPMQASLKRKILNPFGQVTLSNGSARPKVPYNMFVAGSFLYAMICDDENPWDFRWICKYKITEDGLELVKKIEPEYPWQCYHSFCYRNGEIWAAVTASDQYTFENPSSWIGYTDAGEGPLD